MPSLLVLLLTALAWFLAVWSSIGLLDYLLRIRDVRAYVNFVERYELSISLFQIRFVAFRSPCKKLKLNFIQNDGLFSWLLIVWFTLGMLLAVCCFFGIIFYLSKIFLTKISLLCVDYFYSPVIDGSVMRIHRQWQRETVTIGKQQIAGENDSEGLNFVIPGWNIPWAEVPLYIIILLIAAVVHEMGHLLAALTINVPVSSLGFIIVGVYFGAYVEIDTTALLRSSPLQKLGISCAGIWHNLVLASFALVLYEATPWIVLPLYTSNAGIFVENIRTDSPLYGPVGLQKGDVIRAISGCTVRNINDWNYCLKNMKYTDSGYCIPNKVIAENIADEMQLIENELDCCYNSTFNNSASHMCFYVRDWITDIPMRSVEHNHELLEYFSAKICSCLSARYVAGLQSCSSSDDCKRVSNSTVSSVASTTTTIPHASCAFPALLGNMSFMRISIGNESRVVLYVGYVKELEIFVQFSNFVPRLSLSSTLLPHTIELVAKYLFTFSFAFAIINAVPCFYLDGQYISSNLVDIIFHSWRPRKRRLLKRLILAYGTTILLGNIIIAFLKLYSYAV